MVFNPIEEALEQYHFIVAVFYKEITLIAKRRLELKSLKHSETGICNHIHLNTMLVYRH
jgi:hypothetical protein